MVRRASRAGAAAALALIDECDAVLHLGADGTMTDALATRDMLRLRHSVLGDAATAASGAAGAFRQMRPELRQISTLPVVELRATADATAQELRELDNRIQHANWTNDLMEDESGSR